MRKLIYLLFVCICLTGCKKCKSLSGHTEVSGRVLDAVTGKPVPNAQVALGILESTWGGVNGQNVEQMTADSKGNYSFTFTALKNKNYYIIATADNYFENNIEAYPVKEGYKTTDYNIGLPPQGTVKFHIRKTDMSYDSLSLGILTGQGNCIKEGKLINDYCIFSHKKGGENFTYDLRIIKYNGNVIFSDILTAASVYCLPIDTTYVDLNY